MLIISNVRDPNIADIENTRQKALMNLRSLLTLLLPYRRTTEEKARAALLRCGVSPEAIAWKVGADGSFAFGKKHPDAESLTMEQIGCVLGWTRRERIKVGYMAWERNADQSQH